MECVAKIVNGIEIRVEEIAIKPQYTFVVAASLTIFLFAEYFWGLCTFNSRFGGNINISILEGMVGGLLVFVPLIIESVLIEKIPLYRVYGYHTGIIIDVGRTYNKTLDCEKIKEAVNKIALCLIERRLEELNFEERIERCMKE